MKMVMILFHPRSLSHSVPSQARGAGELCSLAKEVLLRVQDERQSYHRGAGPLRLPSVRAKGTVAFYPFICLIIQL